MSRFIFGDSYGDVANRELAYDASRDNRYFRMLADQRQQEAAAREEEARAANLELALRQLNQSGQESAAARQQSFMFHGDEQAYRQKALGQNANLFLKQLASNESIADQNKQYQSGLIDRNDADTLYKEVVRGIDNEVIQTPEQLTTFVGNRQLLADDLMRLNSYLQRSFDLRKQKYVAAGEATTNLNAEYARRLGDLSSLGKANAEMQTKIKAATPEAEKSFWKPGTWGPSQEKLSASMPVVRYNTERDKFMESFNKDKRYPNLAQFDSLNNTFVPAVAPPTVFGTNTLPTFKLPPAGGSGAGTGTTNAPAATGARNAPSMLNVPSAQWPTIPKTSIKVHPIILDRILAEAGRIANPNEREIWVQRQITAALKEGTATQQAPQGPTGTDDPDFQLQMQMLAVRDSLM